MADPLPAAPSSFRPIQHYLKTAVEHDKRDPIVSYYCRLYAMQKAMEIDRKSPECRNYLTALMMLLEKTKKELKDQEAIQNELVGQAHMETYAIKLFFYADTEDRAGRFGKNVVKSFYTAGMLMDVLTNFGELPEDLEKNRKYAKWKAAYIHNCLKNGEVPHAGPLGDEMGEFGEGFDAGYDGGEATGGNANPVSNHSQQVPGGYSRPSGYPGDQPPGSVNHQQTQPVAPANYQPAQPLPPQGPSYQAVQPSAHPAPSPAPRSQAAVGGAAAAALKAEDYTKAMKYCKFASSALQYEDAKTAIDNLTKALNLLTTGHD